MQIWPQASNRSHEKEYYQLCKLDVPREELIKEASRLAAYLVQTIGKPIVEEDEDE